MIQNFVVIFQIKQSIKNKFQRFYLQIFLISTMRIG